MDPVPTIDIARPDADAVAALDAACRDHGFFLLAGHGLDALIDRTWQQTRAFFDAPRALRMAIQRSEDSPLGWYDRELTKRKRDHKEVFDYIDPDGPGDPKLNRWPEALPGFRDTLTEFFDAFAALSAETLRFVHASLGLDDDTIAAHGGSRMTSSVRLNHYPPHDPVPADERDGLNPLGETALGYHTDPGVITLLLQDDTGGLQTRSARDGWIDVPPRPGTIVVNLADTVQVWTNDRYRAAVHRVVPMTTRRRFSIPFFYNPEPEAVIEPIPALCDEPARYRPFAWGDFMRARTEDNFRDLGEDDTQIGHYRIAS